MIIDVLDENQFKPFLAEVKNHFDRPIDALQYFTNCCLIILQKHGDKETLDNWLDDLRRIQERLRIYEGYIKDVQ
jgi:hypothetical protein